MSENMKIQIIQVYSVNDLITTSQREIWKGFFTLFLPNHVTLYYTEFYDMP